MVKIVNNEKETIEFAKEFKKKIKGSKNICLVGDLGSGKTVLARSLIKSFGVKDQITSPTFTLLKTYDINDKKIKRINHFDIYRIGEKDLEDIGFFDYVYDENAINIIEWADLIKDNIPKNSIWIEIKKIDDCKREIIINE